MASLAVLGSGESTRLPYGLVRGAYVAAGATDALPVRSSEIFVTTAGVNAMTLATPLAGIYSLTAAFQSLGEPRDDGKLLRIVDVGGHAHTITTAANKINSNKHIATFNGTVGSFIEFIAFNGIWYALAASGVALT